VRRAYRERRALYASDSLATYTLIDDEERETLLNRLENAYRAIMGSPSPTTANVDLNEPEPVPDGPEPSLELEPGPHLRYHRLHKRLTLAQVADEIKVRPSQLNKIEQELVEQLPAAVYVRGFILQYAKLVGLADPEGVAAAYLAKMDSAPGDP
jgi:hypothetical protein